MNDGRNLYNPTTLTLNVPLADIKGTLDGRVQIYETALLDAISQYQQILDDLVPFEFEAGRIKLEISIAKNFKRTTVSLILWLSRI